MNVDCGVDINLDLVLKPHELVPKGVATKQQNQGSSP